MLIRATRAKTRIAIAIDEVRRLHACGGSWARALPSVLCQVMCLSERWSHDRPRLRTGDRAERGGIDRLVSAVRCQVVALGSEESSIPLGVKTVMNRTGSSDRFA